jgi:hypothetical protein
VGVQRQPCSRMHCPCLGNTHEHVHVWFRETQGSKNARVQHLALQSAALLLPVLTCEALQHCRNCGNCNCAEWYQQPVQLQVVYSMVKVCSLVKSLTLVIGCEAAAVGLQPEYNIHSWLPSWKPLSMLAHVHVPASCRPDHLPGGASGQVAKKLQQLGTRILLQHPHPWTPHT